MQLRVLAFVLAGGKGTRLYPLTKERAKPAVPFGGRYRIVDFVLSNLVNSGIYSIYVLIQFKSQSLLQHLSEGWEVGGLLQQHFIIPVPAQMRSPGEDWYRGTADALHQNINLIEQADPHFVIIFGADHIYRMNIREMLEYHMHKRAQATIAAIPVQKDQAIEFGVIETLADGTVIGFHEKRADPPTMPGDPERVYASMGNYIFSTNLLLRELYADAQNEDSSHDFGRDILPGLVGRTQMFAYDFQTNRIPGDPLTQEPYWRDVGTIDAYYDANMDLRAVTPALNLYNRQWPLRTAGYSDAPAKFIFDEQRSEEHTSELQSLTNLVCRLLLEKKKNKRRESVMILSVNSARSVRSSTVIVHGFCTHYMSHEDMIAVLARLLQRLTRAVFTHDV